MDSLAEVEVRTKISVEVVLTAPFTDLSKGGDTTVEMFQSLLNCESSLKFFSAEFSVEFSFRCLTW